MESKKGKNFEGFLKALKAETIPMEGHEDIPSLNSCWNELFNLLPVIDKALLFVEHLEAHPEVQKAPKNAGIPMCKVCDKTIDEIYKVSGNSSHN